MAAESDIITLRCLIEDLQNKRREYEDAKRVASERNAEVEALEYQVMKLMEVTGLDRFDTADTTVTVKEKQSVKVPKDHHKLAFFRYLKDQGVFEDMATINSNTLNSWYRNEIETRRAKGLDEHIPGLEEVSTYYQLSVRAR